MSKLKVIKRKVEEIETNLDLPVYLYFQDEMGLDELVKITEHNKITIKHEWNQLTISIEENFQVENYIFETCLTTEKHFNDVYLEAQSQLSNAIK